MGDACGPRTRSAIWVVFRKGANPDSGMGDHRRPFKHRLGRSTAPANCCQPHSPSRRCGRGEAKQRRSWSPMTSWRTTGMTCALSLWKHAGSVWRGCYRVVTRRCAMTSNSVKRSPATARRSSVTRAGWTSKASSRSALVRATSANGHAWLKTKNRNFEAAMNCRLGRRPDQYLRWMQILLAASSQSARL